MNNFKDISDMSKVQAKPGQTSVFMDKGKPMVYRFDGSSWTLIGEMIIDTTKVYYEGDRLFSEGQYDQVFSV